MSTVAITRCALQPSVDGARRWWLVTAGAWVVGAVAGVAPTAFLGDPAPGLLAAALAGGVAVALVGPLLVAPLVATVVADDDRHQVAAALHTVGVANRARVPARSIAAGRKAATLLPVGALAGVVAAAGLASTGTDGWSVGLRSGLSAPVAALACGLAVLSVVLGALIGVVAASPIRALGLVGASLVVTGAVASLLYFVPDLRPLFWCMPWAALWPFDPQAFDSAQFATSIPPGVRLASGAAWLGVLTALARRRLVTEPYPRPGESRRRS